jgi:uncharacterized protein (TIGR00369 family)
MSEALSPAKEREVRESFERQGMLRALGAVMTDVRPGRCTLELPFSDAVAQQRGFFHGGAIGALADTAGGYAALTMLPEGADVLTLEYKVNFLRPAAGELLVAEGFVLRSGRTVSVVRVDVHAVSGGERKLCAAMQQSVATAPAREG